MSAPGRGGLASEELEHPAIELKNASPQVGLEHVHDRTISSARSDFDDSRCSPRNSATRNLLNRKSLAEPRTTAQTRCEDTTPITVNSDLRVQHLDLSLLPTSSC